MRTLVSERGQVVIPKKVREIVHLQKGDELEVEVVADTIVLRPVRRFRASRWQDYAGLGDGIVSAHLRDRETEREREDLHT